MKLTREEVLTVLGGCAVGPKGGDFYAKVSTDTRTIEAGDLFVALVGENFDGHDFVGDAVAKGAAGVVVSKPVGETEADVFAVANTLEALGELAHYVREKVGMKVLAITGSVGKTTTKEMASAVLRGRGVKTLATPGNLNNLIGLPLTILGCDGDETVAVLELGISVPGEMARLSRIARPDVALITSVEVAHTEGLGSAENVALEKLDIAKGLKEDGTLLLPFGHPLLQGYGNIATRTFGWDEGADHRGADLNRAELGRYEFAYNTERVKVGLPGRHNSGNALAALAALELLTGETAGADALAKMNPLPMRCEVFAGKNGVTCLADCYNASPAAVEAALELLSELAGNAKKYFVFGEMKELGAESARAHDRVGALSARYGIDWIFLIGEETRRTAEAAQRAGMPRERTMIFDNRDELAARLVATVAEGDWLLIKGSRSMKLDEVARAIAA